MRRWFAGHISVTRQKIIINVNKRVSYANSKFQFVRAAVSKIHVVVSPVSLLVANSGVCLSMLGQLDFAINVRKSVCIRIGPRCQFSWSPILLSDGSELQWVDNVLLVLRIFHVLLIMPRSPFTGALTQSLAK